MWVLPLLTGWDSDECRCNDCEPPKESASDIVARKYANGELSQAEMEEKLQTIEQIDATDDEGLETLLDD